MRSARAVGAWFRINETESTAEVGLCCAHVAQCTSVLSSGFPVSQGNGEALDRCGGKQPKHHLITYFLGNTSAENYHN